MYALIGREGLLGKEIEKELKRQRLPYKSFGKKELDITNISLFPEKLRGVFCVINCAAYTNVTAAEKNADLAYSINVLGPKNLATYLQRFAPKTTLLHFSTDYVFDGKSHVPYTEDVPPNPLNVYGKTKLEGEKYVLSFAGGLVIRTSWLFSADPSCFVGKILHALEEKESVFVVDDQIGRPTFAKDLAKTSLLLQKERGLLHYANEGATSWSSFAKEIAEKKEEIEGKHFSTKIIPISSENQIAKRPSYSVLSTKRYEERYGSIPSWRHALFTAISELAYAR